MNPTTGLLPAVLTGTGISTPSAPSQQRTRPTNPSPKSLSHLLQHLPHLPLLPLLPLLPHFPNLVHIPHPFPISPASPSLDIPPLSPSSATKMTPSSFYLPDLERSSPFPLRSNLHYQPTASISNEWISGYGIHPNQAHRIGFESCAFGLLVSYCYPRADMERFRVLCDFINSLFAFDDLMDEEHLVRDVHGTRAVMDIAMNGLWHPETYQTDFQVGQSIQE